MGGVRGKEEKKRWRGGMSEKVHDQAQVRSIRVEKPRRGDKYPGGTQECVVGEMGCVGARIKPPFKGDEGK